MIALPAADVAEPFLDVDDVADVAVAMLTRDGHAGRTYELTGPRLLTFADVAAELTRATSREIGYLPITAISVYFGTRLEGLSLTDPLVIGTAAGLLALLLGGHWAMRRQAARNAS